MPYSVKEQPRARTNEIEYIVVNSSGREVPPPRSFSTSDGALGRIAGLEREDALELLAKKLNAKPPSPGMRCYRKIVAASDNLLLQHLGMNQYVLHQRANSEALAEVEAGDLVRIVDDTVEYPDREQDRSPGLSP